MSAGKGKWGQADMAGSVFEWAQDFYADPYPGLCSDCAVIAGGSNRVIRGGNFYDFVYLAASYRSNTPPTNRSYKNGARCARTP